MGERPPRPAHQLGRTCGATSGARSMPGEALARPSRCARTKAHTTPEAVLAGVTTAEDRAVNDLADAACKLVVSGTLCPAERPGGEAFGQPCRHMHGSLDCARRFCETALGPRLDSDPWAWTGDCEKTRGSATLAPEVASALRPSSEEGARLSRAPQGASSRSARHAARGRPRRSRAPDCAAHRNVSGLTALRATELLFSCRESRWFQCSTSCAALTVVVWCEDRCSATALGARTLGKLLALRDVLLGFLRGSKRTARLGSIPGRSFACLVWSMSHQGPFS